METKVCNNCSIEKPLGMFGNNKLYEDGKRGDCKKCRLAREKLHKQTKKGLITSMYGSQLQRSRLAKREVMYTKAEFSDWVYRQDNFIDLFDEWKCNGHKKEDIPSVDRLDDFKGYSFENIRLVSWDVNMKKAHSDKLLGIGTQGKSCKPIHQYTLDGEYIKTYVSRRDAERTLGIYIKVSDGQNGGFIWKR